MKELTGTITEIVFRNEENGYTVAELETEEDLHTVVGTLPEIHEGERCLLRGDFTMHPVYGEQFAFSEFEKILPETEEGIRAYLSSGALPGIGPKMAEAIVARFGTDTLRIMKEEPNRLLEVSGIGPKGLRKIMDSFKDQVEFPKISLFFTENGLSASQALRMYQEYGNNTISLLKENPYRLVDEIPGFGFQKADAFAARLGVSEDSEFRIRSAVKYLLSRHISSGNCFTPLEELKEEAAEFLDLTRDRIFEVIGLMAFDGEVKLDQIDGEDVIYLISYYQAETETAARILSVSSARVKPLRADIDECIHLSEEETGTCLSEEQKQTVRRSVSSGISVITGGPGTGKTTVLSALLSIFSSGGITVLLAAPTGRAAKRITEATGAEAFTIHRMLGYTLDEERGFMRFSRTKEDPLDIDCVIIDEASMIDLLLMHALMDALKDGTRLILVGDSDQLPPVGAGNVLRDLIESGLIPVSRLNTIFRQAKESRIVTNAHRINQGEMLEVNGRDSDFFFLKEKNERKMKTLIADLMLRRIPGYYEGIEPKRDIQVITPVHRGSVGTEQLNALLQDACNPPSPEKAEKKLGNMIFREGDKVMQIKNDYQLTWTRPGISEEQFGVFNGDMGIIHRIDNENGITTVLYDEDRFVSYDNQQLEELSLAYAVTVHKSQGSEFPVVIMPITYFPPMLATRNLLYTAVTRGKRLVILVGNYAVLNQMIENDQTGRRCSGLCQRLSDFVPLREEQMEIDEDSGMRNSKNFNK